MTQITKLNPYRAGDVDIAMGDVDLAGQRGQEPLFLGREEVLDWLMSQLQAGRPAVHLVVRGAWRMGKTALLQQLASGRLGRGVVPVYVDLAAMGREGASLFYRTLAETAVSAFTAYGLRPLSLAPAAFLDDPAGALARLVLQPALAAMSGCRVLFLFDNVSSFLAQMADGYLEATILQDLAQMLTQFSLVAAVWAVVDEPQSAPQLSFLYEAPCHTLNPLSREAAEALLRQPVAYTVVRDVVDYVYTLTGGHPYWLQLYAHALFERQVQGGWRQVMVADVLAIHRALPETVIGRAAATTGGAVPHATLPLYQPVVATTTRLAAPSGLSSSTYRLSGAYERPLWPVVVLILLVSLVVGGFMWQQVMGRMPAPTPLAGVSLGQATATPPAYPTEVRPSPSPVVVVVTATNSETAVDPTLTPTPVPTLPPTVNPATPTPESIKTRLLDGMPMVYVPGGSFMMGSQEGDVAAAPDELPLHPVTLSPFYMDRYEVSVSQYAAFLNTLGGYEEACFRYDCTLPRERVGFSFLQALPQADGSVQFAALPEYEDFPINQVTWYGANAYCQWVGSRLPTEAEWEFAARGDDGRIYPWGNQPPNAYLAVYQTQDFNNLKPVDALPDGASPFGVYGLAGSMWEWTADWYDAAYYINSPVDNPTGPQNGMVRALRGGAWPGNNEADRIRTTNRWSLLPDQLNSTVGFRCAQTPPGGD